MSETTRPLAVVTGAAGVLGVATTKVLVEEGYMVYMADWNEQAVQAAASQFEEMATPISFDVSDADAVHKACEKVCERVAFTAYAFTHDGVKETELTLSVFEERCC